MALTEELTAAIAKELSPEHYEHGWRPGIEAEVSATGRPAGMYLGEYPVLEVDLSFVWKGLEQPSPTQCPCGKEAAAWTAEQMPGEQARDLLAKVTGIELPGEVA
jgi:hypothetical protein